jgi:PKD repeat protein
MIDRVAATAAAAALFCLAANPASPQPAQSFSANPTSGSAPLTVTFTVSPMPSPSSAIDFGDGSAASTLRVASASSAIVTHIYQSNGRYVARLNTNADIVGSATITVGSGSN